MAAHRRLDVHGQLLSARELQRHGPAPASSNFERQFFQGTNFLSGRIDFIAFDPRLGLSLQLLWRR